MNEPSTNRNAQGARIVSGLLFGYFLAMLISSVGDTYSGQHTAWSGFWVFVNLGAIWALGYLSK